MGNKAMIADAHFHFDLLSESVQSALNALAGADVSKAAFTGISAGVWPDHTCALLQSRNIRFASAAQQHGLYIAAGLHPCEVHKHLFRKQGIQGTRYSLDLGAFAELESLAASGKLCAIGETGFDASKDVLAEAAVLGLDKPELLELQWQAFRFCMRTAIQNELPLILHSRDAWAHTLQAIDECFNTSRNMPGRIMIHCYPGSANDALQLAAKGVFLSFGGSVTWPQARRPQLAVAACPLSRLLVETDSPDLAPVLADGTKPLKNSPLYWPEIVAAIALLRNTANVAIAQAAHQNLLTFLGHAEQ